MRLADFVAILISIAWLFAAMALRFIGQRMGGLDRRIMRFVFWELRPLFVPAVIAHTALSMILGDFDFMTAFGFGCNLFNWWMLKDPKDDDDDRWKRRKAKLAKKVSVLGGRLVVAPVPAVGAR